MVLGGGGRLGTGYGIQGAPVSTTPDVVHCNIRVWRTTLGLVEHRYHDSRDGQAKRMILRALGEPLT